MQSFRQNMQVAAAYDDWSRTYDADGNLTRDLDEQVTRKTLGDSRNQSILEIGCGTGKNTRWLSENGHKVHAIDFSAAMIQQAQEKCRRENVTFTLADITKRWPAADASVDLITCNLVLEHISGLGFIFTEAARVLINGGLCFVSELHPFRQYQGVQARFERGARTMAIPAFVHHVSDFLGAAASANLSLVAMNEWWHKEDENKLPRLISFMFRK
ncbi:MAG: class I SAM-dependent methyltransferase [Pyrinomonadaceae bacterium]